jgi:RND family efflux transporter MFP subunit
MDFTASAVNPFRSTRGPCSALFAGLSLVLMLLTSGVNAKSFSGLIYPLHDITLSAGVAGLVMKRPVLPGQYVKADQVLLELDDRLQAIESERRKAIYEDQSELEAVRERTAILTTLLNDSRMVFNETGSVSKDELLRLEAEYIATKGRLEQLVAQKKRELLDYETAERERLQRRITAPINGIVTKVIPQIGEWAKPGDAIILLVDPSVAVLRLAIPHTEADYLKVGSSQLIQMEAGSTVPQMTGHVSFVSPVADPASGLVRIEITFNNPLKGIKPGIKGSIEINSGKPVK